MKVAISTLGRTLEDPIDPRFGRAKGFIIMDMESEDFTYLDNSKNIELAQGAGIQTAQFVADQQVAVVISGHFGPKASQVLQQAGIRMETAPEGTVVRNAVSSLK